MDETYFMEMPTPCSCGEWFDLNDGYSSKNNPVTICEACHEKEVEIEDLKDEIEDYENLISDGQNIRKNKKVLKDLKAQLEKLENS